jgi:hypothetical protein
MESQRGRKKSMRRLSYVQRRVNNESKALGCDKNPFPGAVEPRGEQLYTLREHNHTASYTTIHVNEIKNAIKTHALHTTETPSDIICRHVSGDTQMYL